MSRTRPEVNPQISVPQKKLGAKGVGSVGVSLAFRWRFVGVSLAFRWRFVGSEEVLFWDGEVKRFDRGLTGG